MSGQGFFDMHEKLAAQKAQARRVKRAPDAPSTVAPSPTPTDPSTAALSVSQLTHQIDRTIKSGFPGPVLVRGQISNYRPNQASGHLYLTLKDANATLPCMMWRDAASKLKFDPVDGLDVLATGTLGVYPAGGRYQLYISRLEPLGQGALELAFRQLKARLDAEGLFDPDRKKPIPPYPTRIALVTSQNTAALQDMLKVLARFAFLRLSLFHVPVQGAGSGAKIADAIDALGSMTTPPDLILLARGGGSLEDLWAFNEEVVARAISRCPWPIITGVGHETDVSIADLVADYRAHTPTEAAQVATANWRGARDTVDTTALRLTRALRQSLADSTNRLNAVERHAIFRRPLDRIVSLAQLIDDRQRALTLAVSHRMRRTLDLLSRAQATLQRGHPQHMITLRRQNLTALHARFAVALRSNHRRTTEHLNALERQLRAVGPEQVLSRGYSITTLKRTGALVRSASQVKAGDMLVTRVAEGTVESSADDPKQPTLF